MRATSINRAQCLDLVPRVEGNRDHDLIRGGQFELRLLNLMPVKHVWAYISDIFSLSVRGRVCV